MLPLSFRGRVVLRLSVTFVLLSSLLGMPLKNTSIAAAHTLSANADGTFQISEAEGSQYAEEDW